MASVPQKLLEQLSHQQGPGRVLLVLRSRNTFLLWSASRLLLLGSVLFRIPLVLATEALVHSDLNEKVIYLLKQLTCPQRASGTERPRNVWRPQSSSPVSAPSSHFFPPPWSNTDLRLPSFWMADMAVPGPNVPSGHTSWGRGRVPWQDPCPGFLGRARKCLSQEPRLFLCSRGPQPLGLGTPWNPSLYPGAWGTLSNMGHIKAHS